MAVKSSVLPGRILLAFVAAYILLPVAATLLYSLATVWRSEMLPEGYTLSHWAKSFIDQRFVSVLLRTLGLAVVVSFVTLALLLPAVWWQRVRNPKIGIALQMLAAVPFALPTLIIGLGLLTLTGDYLPQAQGTVWLLGLGHVALAFPFAYWALDNAMAAANVRALSEAASTCGASPFATLIRVILPNVGPGIAMAGIMAFGTSFNELVLTQLLVGSRYETVQLYALNMLKGADADYNLLAVMTVINFTITLVLSIAMVSLNGRTANASLPKKAKS
ncbi:ABC transporter permease subunit [Xinfangfangia sp. CPCC 101601]|uniref:ABC transporter permease subunit n=1 Tax=Pseudogemmobacter lacusdianii TaxID=3069608 RepID=A0ABU0W165_9RHOB|nr:ABC transporter permease subunit [Xinfangfangia sp. CPCC 101601]MDQ2067756.1 ABC transporter permease subunit [Xinfangfangia sp. CPCC 101601]